jgi:hypothetical protein
MASPYRFEKTVNNDNTKIVNDIECTGVPFPRRLGGESDGMGQLGSITIESVSVDLLDDPTCIGQTLAFSSEASDKLRQK